MLEQEAFQLQASPKARQGPIAAHRVAQEQLDYRERAEANEIHSELQGVPEEHR